MSVVLAVDGGNSKTDVALAGDDGALLAYVRGPLSSPHHIGLDGCLEVLEWLIAGARSAAGIDGRAEVGRVLLAGADLPSEEDELQAAVGARGWAERVAVSNDTFAVLRAGTERGWGVAIVCGAGINCVGVAPDGRQVRFPALGPISGDWGGGYDVGMAALAAAARSEDGRGAPTSLERAVPAHFGLGSAAAVGEAIHFGRIATRRVVELAPLVFEEAARDASAAAIVDRVAAEIAAFARATLARLELDGAEVEVALGGGLLQASGTRLVDAVAASLGPSVALRVVREPPIAGAVLLGLDALGANGAATSRARREIAAAAPLVMDPVGVGDG